MLSNSVSWVWLWEGKRTMCVFLEQLVDGDFIYKAGELEKKQLGGKITSSPLDILNGVFIKYPHGKVI